MSGLVYPIGVLVLGRELRPALDAELSVIRTAPEVEPFAHSLTRLTPARWVEPFRIVRDRTAKIETIIVLGPGLIDRIEMQGATLYDRHRSNDEDGRLFFAPYRVLQSGHPLHINVRCSPELFLFDAPSPLPETTAEDEVIIDHAPTFGEGR